MSSKSKTTEPMTEGGAAGKRWASRGNRWKELIEKTTDAIFFTDRRGRLVEGNSACVEMTGFAWPEMRGRYALGFLAREDRQRAGDFYRRQVSEGAAETFFEVSLRTKSGKLIWIGQKVMPMVEEGEFAGFGVVAREITAQKGLIETSKRTEDFYREAIVVADAVPYRVDYATDSFAFIGEGIERMTGYSAREMTPPIWRRLVQESKMQGEAAGLSLEEAIEKTLLGGIKRWRNDCRILTRLGESRWISDSAAQIAGQDGRPVGSVGLLQDITERRRIQDQLQEAQRLESIGQLAGGIAHDFNNILTIIQGHASLLADDGDRSKEVGESARQISDAAARAANLIDQLLTFSRRHVIQPRRLNLNEVVEGLFSMLQRLLGEDVLIRVEFQDAMPLVTADLGMMQQILVNLAVNSRDAMPHGGQLTIRTRVLSVTEDYAARNPEARRGNFVCLSVLDTGCGIPPENIPRLFEPFFTTKDIGKGTGLGLATVYGIVKQHGGWVEVVSEVGRGAHFHTYFPLSVSQPSPSPSPPPAKLRPVKSGGETILLAEDEPLLRELIAGVLSSHDYRVIEASSGVNALEVWKQHAAEIDLLLTDLVMPGGISGQELAEKLQQKNPELRVIFTSGYIAESMVSERVLSRGIHFLQKPYQPETLIQAVRHCLDSPTSNEAPGGWRQS